MLVAKLAAVEPSREAGFANGGSLAMHPALAGRNDSGFMRVNNLITQANTELGIHDSPCAGAPWRGYSGIKKTLIRRIGPAGVPVRRLLIGVPEGENRWFAEVGSADLQPDRQTRFRKTAGD